MLMLSFGYSLKMCLENHVSSGCSLFWTNYSKHKMATLLAHRWSKKHKIPALPLRFESFSINTPNKTSKRLGAPVQRHRLWSPGLYGPLSYTIISTVYVKRLLAVVVKR